MGMGMVGALVGGAMLAPAGLVGFGTVAGFLLGLWVSFAEASARRDPGWSAENERTAAYRVGRLVIAGGLVAAGLAAAGLAAWMR